MNVRSLPALRWRLPAAAVLGSLALLSGFTPASAQSVAREWNEALLESIRNDFARPTVHARNLYHVSIAMYDAWATYEYNANPVLFDENHATTDDNVQAFQEEAMSYACYRVLRARFGAAPGWDDIWPMYDALMANLGYDINVRTTVGNTPAAVGNRVAVKVLAFGLTDGANEQNDYANLVYEPVNEPLIVALEGNPDLTDPNKWQPLALDFFIDQSGNPVVGGFPPALSPEWGIVTPFSLTQDDLTIYPDPDPDFDWWVYHDPGPPFTFGTDDYKSTFELVALWSSHLDPSDGVMWDISPGVFGNGALPSGPFEQYDEYYDAENGGDWGTGWGNNPVTGQPYPPNIVPRGDYARILAEFWADGPDSETPPGHWFTIWNTVLDALQPEDLQMGGSGPVLDPLEYEVKSYLTLGGAMHDTAITAWGIKGYYDYIRPVSALRYMADLGQSSDPLGPSYHPDGIPLREGFIEVVEADDTMVGGKMEHLAGEEGKIAFYAWRGPDYINDPLVDVAGVDWILAGNWWPYQRPSFVTPPFPGYVSGHSTYSRCAANILELITGSPYFPGGLGEFEAPMNEFLVFEDGPSVDVTLQWAAYDDASDQTSLSRIWGGIHPSVDDIPGRFIGEALAPDAFNKALEYFGPPALWEDLGNGLDGIFPAPTLEGFGALAASETIALKLSGAWPSAASFLVVGASQIFAPFKMGVMVPAPDLIVPIMTDEFGGWDLEGLVPRGLTRGDEITFQIWVTDPFGPAGFSASNGLSVTAPAP